MAGGSLATPAARGRRLRNPEHSASAYRDPGRAGTAPERKPPWAHRLRGPGRAGTATAVQSSRTYSKSMDWWLMPREGGAIQLANLPGSVTASGIRERT